MIKVKIRTYCGSSIVEQVIEQPQQIVEQVQSAPVLASSWDIDYAPDDARTFEPTEVGSGTFGRWFLDAVGLPTKRLPTRSAL